LKGPSLSSPGDRNNDVDSRVQVLFSKTIIPEAVLEIGTW